ncbi:MAG: thiamine pyrophosphate-binding protein [Gammaproteobacteria bacterium]|nr:thiamine pyrophosphate-binding protein [Gammaproteobacteria bacterium]
MSELNGGQITARQLQAAGIDTIFGVVGGPMIQVFAAAAELGMKVVNCRHEESACFMASAWGYVNRKPGVMVAASGPGMTNTVTSLHVATESAMPLVVLGGSAQGSTRGIGGFQEADQMAFARPGCKWVQQVDSCERIAELVHLALGKSVNGRPGAVYLDFPGQFVARKIPAQDAGIRESAPRIFAPHPDPQAIDDVADLVAQAQRPLVMLGKGAAWADAGDALEQLVNLGIPYVTSPMGRGVIPDDNTFFMNGSRSHALASADAIVMIGGRFNWIFQFGRQPRYAADVRIAQIDISAEEMYSSADVEIGVVADAAHAARALLERLKDRSLKSGDGEWVQQLAAKREENEARIRERVDSDASPLDPYRVQREIRDALGRDANISVDGEITMGVARVMLPSYVARSRLNAGTTGCMGTGVPYAIGAKLARPDAPSIAVVGDYAFGAAAMELETAARVGANVVFVVCNNEGIAGHTIQDRMFPADAPRIAKLLPANYEKLAELVDGHAERVERADELGPALKRALGANRPAVVHVLVDPKAGRVGGGMYLG